MNPSLQPDTFLALLAPGDALRMAEIRAGVDIGGGEIREMRSGTI